MLPSTIALQIGFRRRRSKTAASSTASGGYSDCAQLLGLALRHAMDDVRRKSVPDIVGNKATRRPGIS
jgi:hypothetical protein